MQDSEGPTSPCLRRLRRSWFLIALIRGVLLAVDYLQSVSSDLPATFADLVVDMLKRSSEIVSPSDLDVE